MVKQNIASTFESPVTAIPLEPIRSQRAPTANDIGFPIGQFWVDIPNAGAYILTRILAGQATWLGINVGSYSTLSALLFTAPAANPVDVEAPTGQGITLRLGDDVGGTFLQVQNESGVPVVLVDSLGGAVFGPGVSSASYIRAGTQLQITGTGGFIGTDTLASGTTGAIAFAAITVDDQVYAMHAGANASTAIGVLEAVVTAGVGFTINSLDATASVETGDLSDIVYFIVRSV